MQEMLRQLHTLREMQRHLLPRTLPQPEGWHLTGYYEAGRWPGGDYYDFLPLPDGRLLILIADASDQGAPAAALVAMVRVVLRSCPLSSGVERLPFCPFREPLMQPPHVLLGRLNQVLAENCLAEQFLTAFAGVLDPVDGNFHYSNAGHPWPRWWHAATRRLEYLQGPAGQPLGLDPQAVFHHKRIELGPGDLLVLYTDGLTTAANDQGHIFGAGRLDEALNEAAEGGAPAVKTALLARLGDFLNGKCPEDDITFLILERRK